MPGVGFEENVFSCIPTLFIILHDDNDPARTLFVYTPDGDSFIVFSKREGTASVRIMFVERRGRAASQLLPRRRVGT